ncbi:DUF3168 domain-containing protein [Thalassorhabdomicrobium marinisediminis]|uniref:DUF3168 domain-containing protein n=1 Tax=Thalassorhabdomicrobium marinisediminis TaxID=2170577 RepID=A0A2T7FVD6_9RHOB|nr:DUF3168 domain-containing protein [Thalassorhabdomicrobium marinisediminis]PVA06112.1 DUF3168 domain-containing protein [Thalassorhabdomicrobium marinisediminis]
MIEPSIALQTALRSTLIADPAVTALVQPDQIRSGSTRPDKAPCVILAGASTEYLGKAPGAQHLARVSLDLHIWAIEDGADTAKAIGFAVSQALIGMSDEQAGFEIDELDQPRMVWLRDPQPELSYTHGVLDVEAVIRWQA